MILFVSVALLVVLVVVLIVLALTGTILPFLPDALYEIFQARKKRKRGDD